MQTASFAALERAQSIAPFLSAHAAEAEQQRTLPKETVATIAEAGLFKYFLTEAAGGDDPDMVSQILVFEEMARADGSAGWIAIANGSSGAFCSAYLEDEAFKQVFHNGEEAIMGGQFAPNGLAEMEEGGYRLNGAWNFGSGTGHSTYVCAGFIPTINGEMQMLDNGMPDMRAAVIPREQINFSDNWDVMGLRGTGSFDYNVKDLFVAEAFTFVLNCKEPKRGSAAFKLGMYPITAGGHSGWAMGVARRALDEVTELAKTKARMGESTAIAQRITFQKDLMRAEAKLRAARLLVLEEFGNAQQAAESVGEISLQQRAMLRVATSHVTEAAKEVCDFAHLYAGTSSIRDGNAIHRCFLDIHTGTQHAFVGERTYTEAAEAMLGLIDDSVML